MKIARVNIYGLIGKMKGHEGKPFTDLDSVKNQLENQNPFDEVELRVDTLGGLMSQGFKIHDHLTSLGVPINSVIENRCYSIGTVIHCAAPPERRSSLPGAKGMIHNPEDTKKSDAAGMRVHADLLEKIENKLVEFYVENTKLSREEAVQAMKVETTYTPDEMIAKGFISKLEEELEAVAFFDEFNKEPMNTLTNDEAKKQFTSLQNSIKDGFDSLKKLFGKTDPVAMVLQDANGIEIDFTDLEEGATPSVGDKATIDGSSAEGEYVMPSGETYVFEGGELKEIKPSEGDDSMESLKEENESLKKELETLRAENNAKDKNLEKVQGEVVGLKTSFAELQKLAGSSFNYKPELDGNDPDPTPGKRKLFKEKNND